MDTEDLKGFLRWQRHRILNDLNYVFPVIVLTVGFYMAISGFSTPAHVFVRINNGLTVLLILTCWILKRHLSYRGKGEDMGLSRLDRFLSLLCAAHYNVYVTLTWGRLHELMLLLGQENQEQEDRFGDPTAVLFSMVSLSLCGHFQLLPTTELLLLAIFAPVQWGVQCLALNTALSLVECVQVFTLFSISCLLGFMGGRRSNIDRLRNYMHLSTERHQMKRIFMDASVPIFVMGRPCGKTNLVVELWNTALEELTQVSVIPGTPLQQVACLQSSSTSVLLSAIEKAAGDTGERTPRKLVPIVAVAGVIWLQVDVSPASNGTKVVVIGSDVTDFVNRHASLLHFVPEDGPGEQNREMSSGRALQGCSALVDPHGLTVLECSPHFNIFMQRRMRGRPFLSHVVLEDRRAVRLALEAALTGNPQPVFLASLQGQATSAPEPFTSSGSSSRRSRLHLPRLRHSSASVRRQPSDQGRGRRGHGQHRRTVGLRITMEAEEGGLLRVDVVSERSGHTPSSRPTTAQEREVGAEGSEGGPSLPLAVGSHYSDPGPTVANLRTNSQITATASGMGAVGYSQSDDHHLRRRGTDKDEVEDVEMARDNSCAADRMDRYGSLRGIGGSRGRSRSEEDLHLQLQQAQAQAQARGQGDLLHLAPVAEAGAEVPTLDALVIHLIDLERHLNLQSFEQSHTHLLRAVDSINTRLPVHRRRWGSSCRDWQCSFCKAGNDKEDEICELCKMGEPEDRDDEEEEEEEEDEYKHGASGARVPARFEVQPQNLTHRQDQL